MGFVTHRLSSSYKEQIKRRPFTMQKGTFYDVKHALLECKRAYIKVRIWNYLTSQGEIYAKASV